MNKIPLMLFFLQFMLSSQLLAGESLWSESYRLEASGNYGPAIKSMDKILEKNPKHEFALLRHGWLNYLQGNHNKAADDYKKAFSINKHSIDGKLGLMLPLMAQNKWKEAARYAKQVIQVASWNYYAHVRLMSCEEALEQWDALAKHAKQVISRFPSDATVMVYLARSHKHLNNKKQASQYYQEVLERVPGHVEATQYLLDK